MSDKLPRMTVGELRRELAKYPAEMDVLTEDGKGWWVHVTRLEGPRYMVGVRSAGHTSELFDGWSDEITGYHYPTFMHGDTFDCREMR